MSIGYACLTVGVPDTKIKSCILKNATPENLRMLIKSNLHSLNNILDYNIRNDIRLFRVSSDLIPFGSHPINRINWWDEFGEELIEIGKKAVSVGMRLSMHPGQYTVLNSPDSEIVKRAIDDLIYHCRFLDSLGLGREHKIVLHIGGIYGDRVAAVQRFADNYNRLDENIRQRLVIENDDRQYSIGYVLRIGKSEGIPVIFDNLHHKANPDNTRSEKEWIEACGETWMRADGPQKIHYSQQDNGKRIGSHSPTINAAEFMQFYGGLPQKNIDVMLEVKDKNLSAVKCVNAISNPEIRRLETEWARYKYLVLERSPSAYNDIRNLLKNKLEYPIIEFYRLIDSAINSAMVAGNSINAAQHVWGYFKDFSDEKAKTKFEKELADISTGKSTKPLKRLLWQLANSTNDKYLLESLYFMEIM